MTSTRRLVIVMSIFVIALVVLAWWASPRTDSPSEGTVAAETDVIGTLVAEDGAYDFGTVSMAAGKVSYTYRVSNKSESPVLVAKLYTSCMCTEASLVAGDTRKGPFGMPGHGYVPRLNQTIQPGEEVGIEVVFDPAAHGPAGVGRVDRVIYLEQADGSKPLQLTFSATVQP